MRERTAQATRLGSDGGTEIYGVELTLPPENCRLEPLDLPVSAFGPPFSRDVAIAVARTSWPVRRVDSIEAVQTTRPHLAALGVIGAPGSTGDREVIVVVIAGELQFPSPHGGSSVWGAWFYDATTGEEISVRGSPQGDPPGLPAWLQQIR